MIQKEPVAVVAAIVAVVQMIVPGLVIFGVADISVEQLAFVEVFIASIAIAIGAVVARARVQPIA